MLLAFGANSTEPVGLEGRPGTTEGQFTLIRFDQRGLNRLQSRSYLTPGLVFARVLAVDEFDRLHVLLEALSTSTSFTLSTDAGLIATVPASASGLFVVQFTSDLQPMRIASIDVPARITSRGLTAEGALLFEGRCVPPDGGTICQPDHSGLVVKLVRTDGGRL